MVDTAVLLRPQVGHDGLDVGLRDMVDMSIGNLVGLVLFVMVVPHVVTDLMVKGVGARMSWSHSPYSSGTAMRPS